MQAAETDPSWRLAQRCCVQAAATPAGAPRLCRASQTQSRCRSSHHHHKKCLQPPRAVNGEKDPTGSGAWPREPNMTFLGARASLRHTVAHCTEILRGQNTEFTYKLGTLTEGISSFKKMSHLNTIWNTQNDALSVFTDTSMRQAVTLLPTVHTQHQTVLCTKMMPPSLKSLGNQ